MYSQGSSWQYDSIGSDDGLALYRQQAIILVKVCSGRLVAWCHQAVWTIADLWIIPFKMKSSETLIKIHKCSVNKMQLKKCLLNVNHFAQASMIWNYSLLKNDHACMIIHSQHCACWWLSHWSGDKMAAIFQTTFSYAFSWMKMYEFRWRFHWILFPRNQLTIFQHWFR